jgi:antitoxin (DNA-binding transcriptional repressor) of toxin-antitoxin stability system
MSTTTIDVREAQTRLPELVSSVASGAEIILTRNDWPIARLSPLSVVAMNRIAGLHSESMWVSPDFNDPLPENYWTGEA